MPNQSCNRSQQGCTAVVQQGLSCNWHNRIYCVTLVQVLNRNINIEIKNYAIPNYKFERETCSK